MLADLRICTGCHLPKYRHFSIYIKTSPMIGNANVTMFSLFNAPVRNNHSMFFFALTLQNIHFFVRDNAEK